MHAALRPCRALCDCLCLSCHRLFLLSVLFSFPVAVIRCPEESKLGERGLIDGVFRFISLDECFACMCICVSRFCLVPHVFRKGIGCPSVGVPEGQQLGIEPLSSRARSAMNYWAASSAPQGLQSSLDSHCGEITAAGTYCVAAIKQLAMYTV